MNDDQHRKAAIDAMTTAVGNLLGILNDASGYLIAGDDLAAWDALLPFDEAADDIKAAFRLHRTAYRGWG